MIFPTWSHFLVSATTVKLDTSPHTGYIQVKHRSTWTYVGLGKNNWDKNRQKMFCEYLGFSDKDASTTGLTFIGRNDTATGDFICYKTHSKEISCCANLKPTNQERAWIPYARCKHTYARDSQLAFAANHFVCGYIFVNM